MLGYTISRGRAAFGQHKGTRPLGWSNIGNLPFTDFQSNLANLIGWEYETNTLRTFDSWCWPKGARPLGPRCFWSAHGNATSGLVQHRKSAIHGLPVKSGKSDWLRIRNQYFAHVRFLVLTKRSKTSEDGYAPTLPKRKRCAEYA